MIQVINPDSGNTEVLRKGVEIKAKNTPSNFSLSYWKTFFLYQITEQTQFLFQTSIKIDMQSKTDCRNAKRTTETNRRREPELHQNNNKSSHALTI